MALPSRLAPLLIVSIAFVASACAHVQRASDVRSRAGEHIYETPIEELWPKVRPIFEAKGFRVREDPNGFSLDTEWKEDFSASRVAGVFRRYMVLGDPLGPTRSRLRVFFLQRTNDKTLERAGSEIEWGPRADMGAQGGAEALAAPDEGITDIQQWSETLDTPDGRLRAEALGSSARRALDMEWELLQQLDPHTAEQIAAGKEVIARAPPSSTPAMVTGTVAPQGAPTAPTDCGTAIPGVARLASPGAVVLLGEVHGTREVPRFVGEAACQIAFAGTPLTVGLELPTSEQDRVYRFLNSNGSPEAMAELVDGRFWLRPYQDGRSSLAMAELLQTLRGLRAKGLDLIVFTFDAPHLQGQAREDAMAAVVTREVQNHPGRFFLLLTGNIHNRLEPGVPWDPSFVPMGAKLQSSLPAVTALDMAYASGTAWICTMGSKLDCGIRPARGKDNGVRPFIHLWGARSEAGYDGVFYVGTVNASEPARGVSAHSEQRPQRNED